MSFSFSAILAGLLLFAVVSSGRPAPMRAPEGGRRFVGIREFAGWTTEPVTGQNKQVHTSPEIDPGMTWDELIVSWNIPSSPTRYLTIEAQALYADRATKWYTMAHWSENPALHPRESVKKQKDTDGDVDTDTLVLTRPADRVRLRVTAGGADSAESGPPAFLGVSFLSSKAAAKESGPNRRAWGSCIDVPRRSQLSYEGGKVWCSPTSTSMVIGYWAKRLKRPDLDRDVPAVAAGVNDPNWPGTGNWPFNTAYAGSLPGMRAYVTRLGGVHELEAWIRSGVPVVCSVSYRLLYGKENPEAGGHIVVCVGFTKKGDPIIHDPWARLERGDSVRQTIPRKNLAAAWAKSKNTVYLIHPETWPIQ
jgi:hypothetical protein